MVYTISDLIKKYASFIERDDTPTEEELRKKREEGSSSDSTTIKYPRKGGEISEEAPKPTPKFKPKRRKLTVKYKDTMKDYMKNYRAQGKDIETGNRYVKKYKGE